MLDIERYRWICGVLSESQEPLASLSGPCRHPAQRISDREPIVGRGYAAQAECEGAVCAAQSRILFAHMCQGGVFVATYMDSAQGVTLADYEKAELALRAEEGRTGFLWHAALYVLVNIGLIVINLVFVSDFLWFVFPLIGWGIGLTAHYLFGVRFVRRETRQWQTRVEGRARAMGSSRSA